MDEEFEMMEEDDKDEFDEDFASLELDGWFIFWFARLFYCSLYPTPEKRQLSQISAHPQLIDL